MGSHSQIVSSGSTRGTGHEVLFDPARQFMPITCARQRSKWSWPLLARLSKPPLDPICSVGTESTLVMTGTRRDRKLPAAVDAVLTASIRIIDDGNNMSGKWVFYAITWIRPNYGSHGTRKWKKGSLHSELQFILSLGYINSASHAIVTHWFLIHHISDLNPSET